MKHASRLGSSMLFALIAFLLQAAPASARDESTPIAEIAEITCGGITGIQCLGGQFCELPEGLCEWSDLGGVCVPAPQLCTREYDPVCGCDGKTYGNDCARRAAQVQKDYNGECVR